VSVRENVGPAAVRALSDVAFEYMWRTPPGQPIQKGREAARFWAGDLQQLRLAGVGLVPDAGNYRNGYVVAGEANRHLHAAGHAVWVRPEEMREMGIAFPRQRSYDLAMAERLLFPLRGADGAVGVMGLALSHQRLRWRCHQAVLGLRPPNELVFSAGVDDVPEGETVTVCADPAEAMKFRSFGDPSRGGWRPLSAVVAPGSRQLTAAQVALIAENARGGIVDLFIDEENRKRARQFARALERGGLEVRDVLEAMRRQVEAMERAVKSLNETPRRSRRVGYHQPMAADGGSTHEQ
jgi:hypothetical protein